MVDGSGQKETSEAHRKGTCLPSLSRESVNYLSEIACIIFQLIWISSDEFVTQLFESKSLTQKGYCFAIHPSNEQEPFSISKIYEWDSVHPRYWTDGLTASSTSKHESVHFKS